MWVYIVVAVGLSGSNALPPYIPASGTVTPGTEQQQSLDSHWPQSPGSHKYF